MVSVWDSTAVLRQSLGPSARRLHVLPCSAHMASLHRKQPQYKNIHNRLIFCPCTWPTLMWPLTAAPGCPGRKDSRMGSMGKYRGVSSFSTIPAYSFIDLMWLDGYQLLRDPQALTYPIKVDQVSPWTMSQGKENSCLRFGALLLLYIVKTRLEMWQM